jgi:DNA-binding transcriptional ArsR family regulator
VPGDADIASVAAVLAEPARARIVLALTDGRALPASVLASEAGVAASTASSHLAKLVEAGLVSVERHGRHRYHRLAGPHVAELVETLARHARPAPVRSLRQGSRAHALRAARTCYDHLAGRLGTALMAAMIDGGMLAGGDGRFDAARARRDRLSARGRDVDYRLTDTGAEALARFGVDPAQPIRYCVDWSEQRHHLSGALGRAICARMLELGWIRRLDRHRALTVTPAGVAGLERTFGVALAEDVAPRRARLRRTA